MTTTTDPRFGPVPRTQPDDEGHEAFCAGMEALAAKLRANRDIPVPPWGSRICVAVESAQAVEAAASLLGVTAADNPSQHEAVLSFGPVSYQVWAPNFGEGR